MVSVCVMCVFVGVVDAVSGLCYVSVCLVCECLCDVVWLMWCCVMCCVCLCALC